MQGLLSVFDIHGRLSRGGFFAFFFVSSLYLFAWALTLHGAFIALVPAVVLQFFAIIRRLHDRNRSGWWVLVPYLALALAAVAIPEAVRLRDEGVLNDFGSFAVLVAFGVLIGVPTFWLYIEILFLRGTIGPNRFGSDPLQSN